MTNPFLYAFHKPDTSSSIPTLEWWPCFFYQKQKPLKKEFSIPHLPPTCTCTLQFCLRPCPTDGMPLLLSKVIPSLDTFPIHFLELTEEHCSSKLFFLWHCKFLILYCNISNIKHVQKHMTHKTQFGNQWIPTRITCLFSQSQNPSHCQGSCPKIVFSFSPHPKVPTGHCRALWSPCTYALLHTLHKREHVYHASWVTSYLRSWRWCINHLPLTPGKQAVNSECSSNEGTNVFLHVFPQVYKFEEKKTWSKSVERKADLKCNWLLKGSETPCFSYCQPPTSSLSNRSLERTKFITALHLDLKYWEIYS